ncbi:hypothetical protein [Egbenema bharatensis]|uniref:hypothetical protein n=1 Tax=Egbenema bharatensis TaxID=3463334 RepID=UPI003A89E1AF
MRARIENEVLYLHQDDVPQYKKKGSIVRNNYFWTLRSIAGRANFNQDWEYESEVWMALRRILLFFTESGYLGLRETTLEFPPEQDMIPEVFRIVGTWEAIDESPENEFEDEVEIDA